MNGDRTIDESEVRWFLPSVNEYLRIGIGSSALSNAAQLYIGNKASLDNDIWYTGENQTGDKNYVTAENLKDGTLYYTSSIDDHRTFWAVEKGSYGKDQQSRNSSAHSGSRTRGNGGNGGVSCKERFDVESWKLEAWNEPIKESELLTVDEIEEVLKKTEQ